MRFFMIALVLLVVGLQYKLWFGGEGVQALLKLKHKITAQLVENEQLKQRNQMIVADITELKSGDQALEERARYDLGMIKDNEIYYQFAN